MILENAGLTPYLTSAWHQVYPLTTNNKQQQQKQQSNKQRMYLTPSWNKHMSTSVVENTFTKATLAGGPANAGKQPLARASAQPSLILHTSTLSKYLHEKEVGGSSLMYLKTALKQQNTFSKIASQNSKKLSRSQVFTLKKSTNRELLNA